MDFKLTTVATPENPVVGDLHLTNGQVTLLEDSKEMAAQALSVRFDFFRGEWYRDLRQGIPGWERILGTRNPSTSRLAKMARKVILGTQGIASVSEVRVSFNRETRELSITFRALTKDGLSLDFSKPFIVELP